MKFLGNLQLSLIPTACLICNNPTLVDSPKKSSAISHSISDCLCRKCMSLLECLPAKTDFWVDKKSNLGCIGVYRGALVKILVNYKKGREPGADLFLSRVVQPYLEQLLSEITGPTLLTHPPGSRSGKIARGYDHMAKICRRLKRDLGGKRGQLSYAKIFRRKTGIAQKKLSRAERLVSASLQIDISSPAELAHISGYSVVILDDVITTGATMSRCRSLLKAMGFTAIYCIGILQD